MFCAAISLNNAVGSRIRLHILIVIQDSFHQYLCIIHVDNFLTGTASSAMTSVYTGCSLESG